MAKKHYLRFGGIGFEALKSPKEINTFVRDLPVNKQESMYEVAKELTNQGMIRLYAGDFSPKENEDCL